MAKFRKRPVVIDAFRALIDKPGQWFKDAVDRGDVWYQGGEHPYFTIKTLEGEMRAERGDIIIRGVAGEIYPCKPDIFEATYEPA